VGAPSVTFSQPYGNLIIVTGGGIDESDPMYEFAQYLSDLVYNRFQNRLFQDEDISLLSKII
jgi:hypothetical protein